MNWLKSLRGKIKFGELLKKHTTFKVGGPAQVFFVPQDARDLKLFLFLAKRHKLPFRVLGSGSNVLVKDKGVGIAVVSLNSPDFKKIKFGKGHLDTGSAVLLRELIFACQKKGFSSLEFLIGIPGTVGGALIMNAGAWGKVIAQSLDTVTVMDYSGKTKILKFKDIKFKYRGSGLDKFIILGCRFKLIKKSRRTIKNSIKEFLNLRAQLQDYSHPGAGCVFKNPKNDSAGRLIDLCGLKGRGLGGARISKKHANFILNTKNAKAKDILKLMDLAKRQVKKRFKVVLEPEIKIW